MACTVEVERWPRNRRCERDVRDLFCSFGEIRGVTLRHGPREVVLVRYASAESARVAIRVLHGSRPVGCDDPLTLRAACDECAAMQAELDTLRAQLAAVRATRPVQPPRRPAPPPKRQRSESPPRSDQSGGADVSTSEAFLRIVHDRLGERAAHHLQCVLPPRVMAAVVTTCSRALVYPGKHWTVPDRRAFVNEMRHAVTAPGVLSIFFDWSGFRLVVFVDDEQVDHAAIADILNAQSFVSRFGEFDAQAFSEVLMA